MNNSDLSDFPDFHFIAIGGVGQSALAKILLQLGYKVSGSDINDSKYVHLVEKLGAKVYIGHNKDNIKGTPKIVVSSAIKDDNPEIIRAKELKLDIIHRSDCLKIISEKFPKFIGLAGTHGKTTTSGLISFVLEMMKQNPSYAIGGIIPKLNINASAKISSKYFIAELDESDGTIQKYAPNYFVINNLEADHLDHYKNGLDDIIPTFERVVDNMKDDDVVFINLDNDGNKRFLAQTKAKNIITYALNSKADFEAKNVVFDELNSSFDVYKKDEFLGKINLIVPGKHNVYNAIAIVSVLDCLGFKFEEYAKHFSEFTGMGRRFQLVGDVKNIKIIDDYAHHPSEIQSTLNSIKDLKRRKVAIFQPHRYTRLKGLWDEFLKSFDVVDKLFVLDVFTAGDKPSSIYNSENFVAELKAKNKDVAYVSGGIIEAGKKIAPLLKENDIVILLGAGDITKMGGELYDLLSN